MHFILRKRKESLKVETQHENYENSERYNEVVGHAKGIEHHEFITSTDDHLE